MPRYAIISPLRLILSRQTEMIMQIHQVRCVSGGLAKDNNLSLMITMTCLILCGNIIQITIQDCAARETLLIAVYNKRLLVATTRQLQFV